MSEIVRALDYETLKEVVAVALVTYDNGGPENPEVPDQEAWGEKWRGWVESNDTCADAVLRALYDTMPGFPEALRRIAPEFKR